MTVPSKDLSFHAYNMKNFSKEEIYLKSKEIHALFQNDRIEKIICDFPLGSVKCYDDTGVAFLEAGSIAEKRTISITEYIIPYIDKREEFCIGQSKLRRLNNIFLVNIPLAIQIANYGVDNSITDYNYMRTVAVDFLSVSRNKRTMKLNIASEAIIKAIDNTIHQIPMSDERPIQAADHIVHTLSKGEIEIFFEK